MDALWSEVLSFIGGLLTGVTLKVVVDRRNIDRSSTTTVQKDNEVGGHQAGRDVNVREDDDRS